MFSNKKFIFIGAFASLILLVFYFSILSLAESLSHAVSQFWQSWYWILLLVAGFGTQVGLFAFVREKQKAVSGKTVAASGGVSTGAMIACCLHHAADVLPLMGLAAAAAFLTQYQVWFIILGVLSNLVGIAMLLELIQRNNLAGDFFKKILIFNMGQVKKTTIGASLILLVISFFLVSSQEPLTAAVDLPSGTDSQGGISFKVTPLDPSINNPLKFRIEIDTHSGSLDFDLAKVSKIEDGLGREYRPLGWEGPFPGGHHISGVLSFPRINGEAEKIKLTIQDAYLRIFEWELK